MPEAIKILMDFNLSSVVDNLVVISEQQSISLKTIGGTQLISVSQVAMSSIMKEGVRVPPNCLYQQTIPRLEMCKLLNIECSICTDQSVKYNQGHEHAVLWPYDLESPIKVHKYLFDENYYDTLVDFKYSLYLSAENSSDLLVKSKVDQESLENAASYLSDQLLSLNSKGIERPKQSFLIPLVTGRLKYGSVNEIDYGLLRNKLFNSNYLKSILLKAEKGYFLKKHEDTDIIDGYDMLKSLQSELHFYLKSIYPDRIPKSKILKSLLKDDETYQRLHKRVSQKHYEINRLVKEKSKSVTLSRTVSIAKNDFNGFSEEMSHFSKNKDLCGVKDSIVYNYDFINTLMHQLFEFLKKIPDEPCKMSPFDENTGPGPKYLTKLKNEYLKRPIETANDYRESNIGKCAEFASRFCHSMFKLSMTTSNCRQVSIDNLGYENVILFVRGGPKASKTGNCRLFRIVYPYQDYFDEILGYNEDYQKIQHEGQCYILTPWTQYSINIIKTGMNLYHSLYQMLTVYCIRDSITLRDMPHFELLSALLGFHQKRQTEVTLHNSRYLIVNSSGQYSNLKGIVSSFCSYNYTMFDAWIKESIRLNLDEFFKQSHSLGQLREDRLDKALQKVDLRHFITGELLKSSVSLTSTIYCTYAMTTGQYNKALEQASNLSGILKDVQAAKGKDLDKADTKASTSIENLDLYVDDFKFDPKFCQYIGYVMGSCINSRLGVSNISNHWNSSIDKTLLSTITPSGLRGFNEKNFFNQKGYTITYDFILEKFSEELSTKVEELDTASFKEKIKMIKLDKVRMSDCCMKWELVDAVFHAVDKQQRAGGREIYVMDIVTKFFQQPIESFLSKLCVFVDNEYISVPSDRRAQKIHNLYYDEVREHWPETWNLVLDCRRWAPRSVIQKYVHFIHGMESFLPESFVSHFYYFFDKMLTKKIFVRDYVVKTFKNNSSKQWMNEELKEGEGKYAGSHYFEMNASFLMGMFNYLSSLMHAANQLVISNVIRDRHLRTLGKLTIVKPIAHSDDSTAKILTQTTDQIEDCLLVYDVLLKAANHMISVKKSVVSKVYQEFLSVLYFFGENLSVLKKFCSSINFTPTDKGYSVDITYAASKAMEALKNGATFQESYLIMKVTESAIRYTYKMPRADPNMFFGVMGLFDPHPIELMIAGTECEFYKHCTYNKEKTNFALDILHKWLKDSDRNFLDPVVKWDMKFSISPRLKLFFEKKISGKLGRLVKNSTVNESWTLTNGRFDSTMLSLVAFEHLLKEGSFYKSLMSDPTERALARVFGAYYNRTCIVEITDTDNKPMKLTPNVVYSTISEIINNPDILPVGVDFVDKYLEVIEPINNELSSIYECFDNMLSEVMTQNQNLTLKPVQAQIFNNLSGIPTEFPLDKIVTYVKEPENYWMYGDERDPSRQVDNVKEHLNVINVDINKLDPDDLYKVLRRLHGNDLKLVRFQAHVESNKRFLRGPSDLLEIISSNSIYNKRIIMGSRDIAEFGSGHFDREFLIPSNVREYAKLHWAICYIRSKNLENFLRPEATAKMEKTKNKIDASWRIMVENTVQSQSLSSLSYWYHWIKPQTKMGVMWMGEGELFVKTPEANFVFNVCNHHLISIKVDNVANNFSKTTDWFLSQIIDKQIRITGQMIDVSGYSILENFISFNTNSGWSINQTHKNSCIFPIEIEESIGPSWKDGLGATIRRSGRLFYDNDGVKKEIHTVLDQPETSIQLIKKTLDIPAIKQAVLIDRTITQRILDFQIHLTGRYRIAPEVFVQHLQKTLLYGVLYDYKQSDSYEEDSPNNFLRSLIHHKERNPSFGFPSFEELQKTVNDPLALRMPDCVNRTVMRYPKFALSEKMKKSIMNELSNALRDGSTSRIRSFFQPHSQNMLAVFAMKSDVPFDIIRLSLGGMGTAHLDWLIELLIDIKAFIQSTDLRKIFGSKNALKEFRRTIGLVLTEMSYCKKLPDSENTQDFRVMIERLCRTGLLNFLERTDKTFWCMQDFESKNADDLCEIMGCLLHSASMRMHMYVDSDAARSVDTFVSLYKLSPPIIRFKSKLNMRLMSRSGRANMQLEEISTEDAVGGYVPGNQIDVMEMEDFLDELAGDGDVTYFEQSEIGNYDPVFFRVNLLNKRSFLRTAGTSNIVVWDCIAMDREICSLGYNLTYFRNLNKEHKRVGDMIVVTHPSNIRVEFEGYQGSKRFPNFTTFDIQYGLKSQTRYGTEIYNSDNYEERYQLEEASRQMMVNTSPDLQMKKKNLIESLENIGNNDFASELAKKIRQKMSPANKVSMNELIRQIMEKDLQNIGQDMDNLIVEVTKETKVDLPQMLGGITTLEGADILTDADLISELDTIHAGLANKLLRGEIQLTEKQCNMIRRQAALMRKTNESTILRDTALSMEFIIENILANVVYTRLGDDSLSNDLMMFLSRLLPDLTERPNNSLPLPLYRDQGSINWSMLEEE